jgi:hypothetical protein
MAKPDACPHDLSDPLLVPFPERISDGGGDPIALRADEFAAFPSRALTSCTSMCSKPGLLLAARSHKAVPWEVCRFFFLIIRA